MTISKRLVTVEPNDPVWRRELMYSYSNIGDVMGLRDDPEASLEAFREALKINQALVVDYPANLDWKFEQVRTQNRTAAVLRSMGRLQEAHGHYRACLNITSELVEAEPSHMQWRSSMGSCHHFLGALATNFGQLDEAFNHFRTEMEIEKELADHDPENPRWQRESFVGATRLAMVLTDLGRFQEAVPHYLGAMEALNRLMEKYPEEANWRCDLAIGHHGLGRVHLARRELDSAEKEAQTALTLVGMETPPLSETCDFEYWEADSLILIGRIEATRGRADRARARWRKALEVIETMATSKNAINRRLLLARSLLYLDRLDEARPVVEELLAFGYRHPPFLDLCRSKGLES
jgi:tetratricopeptide (TPR) repeat protein